MFYLAQEKSCSSIAKIFKENAKASYIWQLRKTSVCSSTEEQLTRWLKCKPFSGEQARAIFSDKQIDGVGQRGRKWLSPMGGVWVSAALPIRAKCSHSQLLGLAVALALSQRLELKKIDVLIKWPNDLIVGGLKLAGILPRLVLRGNQLVYVRVGLGLNVANPVPEEAISLENIVEIDFNKTVDYWSAEVLLALENAMILLSKPEYICFEVYKRLWSKEYFESTSNSSWRIVGIEIDGALKVSNGRESKNIRNI